MLLTAILTGHWRKLAVETCHFRGLFRSSVKLFEPAGLVQGRLTPPSPEQAVDSHWRSFEQPFSPRRITKNNFVRDRDDMPSFMLFDHVRIKQFRRRN
jgi:hypothetical protein